MELYFTYVSRGQSVLGTIPKNSGYKKSASVTDGKRQFLSKIHTLVQTFFLSNAVMENKDKNPDFWLLFNIIACANIAHIYSELFNLGCLFSPSEHNPYKQFPLNMKLVSLKYWKKWRDFV